MASSSSLRISPTIHGRDLVFQSRRGTTTNLFFPRRPSPSSSVLTFSRRRRSSSSSDITPKTPKKKPKEVLDQNVEENDDLDEDAFEALFKMLEEDLKNDELLLDDDGEEISEEDLKKLEEELEEALKDGDLLAAFGSNDEEEDELDDEDNEDKEDEHLKDGNGGGENQLQLKNWQLRRLAQAMKKGRRKISIKNLAADLCLDRAIVLDILREPPPSLLMLSAALPDEPTATTLESVPKPTEPVTMEEVSPLEQGSDDSHDTMLVETVAEKVPVHVMQRNWSGQKRLKKVQLDTLENIYRRTKRPTNAMISSIVHVTNLPRKKVVKWFEDKRSEEGVPSHRIAYQPSTAETANTQ